MRKKDPDKNPSHIIYCSLEFTTAFNGYPLLDGILRCYETGEWKEKFMKSAKER